MKATAMSGIMIWYIGGLGVRGKPYDRLKECTLVGLLLSLLLCATADDEFIVWAVRTARLDAECMLTPWGLRILKTDRRVSFSSSVRVVYGVHGLTENFRLLTFPTVTTCFSDSDEVMVRVGNASDGGVTLVTNLAHFTTWKLDDGERSVETDEDGACSCGADDLSAAVRLELNVVDAVTDGNVLKHHAVSWLHFRALTTDDFVINFESFWSQDVTLLTVDVVNESDVSGTVWIVLDGCNAAIDALLVGLLEVDETQELLVSPSAVADGDAAQVVTARDALLTPRKALFRAFLRESREVGDTHLPSRVARWFLLDDGHGLGSAEGREIELLALLREGDDHTLAAVTLLHDCPLSDDAGLWASEENADRLRFNIEVLTECAFYINLRCVWVNFDHVHTFSLEAFSLLCDDWADDDG